MSSKFPYWVAVTAASLALLSGAFAQTWNVNSNGNWSTTGNWTPGTVPNAVGANVTLGNIITANRVITVDGGNKTLGTLTINDNNNYTIQTNTLILDVASGSATINIQNSGSPTISSGLQLNDNTTINHTGTGLYTQSGAVNLQANTLTVQGTGSTEIGGVVSGTGAMAQTGTGTLTLNANNTFSGGLTISSGTVQIGNNGATGTGTLTLNGGTLVSSGAARTVNDAVTVGGNFTVSGTNDLTLSGAMALGGTTRTVTTDNTGATIFSGVVSGTGGLTKAGTGTLSLSGNNTFSGATTINAGTLQISNNNALGSTAAGTTVASGAALALTGGITIPVAETLTVSGSGVSGGGALRSVSGSNTWNGNITLGANAEIENATSGTTFTLGSTAFTQMINLTASGYTATFDGAGDIFLNAGITGSGTLSSNGPGNVIKNGSGTLTYYADENFYTGTTTVTDGMLVLDTIQNRNGAVKGDLYIGDGTGAANSAVVRNGAATSPAASQMIVDTATVYLNTDGLWNLNTQSETVAALNMTGGSVTTGTGILTLTASTPITSNAASSTASISGNLALTGGGTKVISVADGSAATDLDISANISEPFYTSLNKTGDGTLRLSGNNTFTGDVTVSGGVLVAASNNALGATATYGNTVSSGAALHLSGGVTINESNVYISGTGPDGNGSLRSISGNNTWGGVVTLNAASTIAADAGTSLTLNNSIAQNYNATFTGDGNITASGNIYGSGGLTKTGTGTLTLSGSSANSYGGGTTVSGGTLVLAKTAGTNATGTTGVLINSGGTLLLGASNQIADYTNMTLAGGTFSSGATTGFSETLGTLTLTSSSSIDFGSGSHLLNFANSSAASWTGTLTIYDWVGTPGASGTAGQIFFGTSASGLTSAQLAQVSFSGYGSGAMLLGTGQLVPVAAIPEPGVVFAGLLVMGLIAWKEREWLVRFRMRHSRVSVTV